MIIINQFTDSLLLKNKELLKWPQQRKLFSFLYLLMLSLLISLLIIFWSVSSFNSQKTVQAIASTQFEIKNNELQLTDDKTIKKVIVTENLTLNQEFLDYDGIRISYQQLSNLTNQKILTQDDFITLLSEKNSQIRFFLFIFSYLKALPFIVLTLVFSFLIGKLCHNVLKKNVDLTFATAYMYTCYAFTPPLFLFAVLNLVTRSLFDYLWILYLLTALNVFTIIWLKNKELANNN